VTVTNQKPKTKTYIVENQNKSTVKSIEIQNNVLLFMLVLFYSCFVCMSAYANVYFKTTIFKQNIKIILIAGVPSSQALLGFLITAPPFLCVPDVIGVLAVWISNKTKKKTAIYIKYICIAEIYTYIFYGVHHGRRGWSECCLQVDTPNAEAGGLGCIGLRASLVGAAL